MGKKERPDRGKDEQRNIRCKQRNIRRELCKIEQWKLLDLETPDESCTEHQKNWR